MMKYRSWQIFLMISIAMVLIAACQSAPAPALTTPEPASTEVVQEEQASPEPGAYPPPVPSRYVPYPSPGEGERIDWAQAREMILGGEVNAVFQSSSNQVTLYLKNRQQVVTLQPETDDIIRVIEECGAPCEFIRIGME